MNIRIILTSLWLAAAMGLPLSLRAQNLDENVMVEGRYSPEFIAADRLPSMPGAIRLAPPESSLEYERRGVAAAFAPDALSMAATGWRSSKDFDHSRGYIDFSLGSWLNSSLSAGWVALQNADTRLNLWMQHNSTSLWRPDFHDAPNGSESARRYRYDETLGADLKHHFSNTGTLSADLRYHFGSFNYFQALPMPAVDKAPHQILNDFYARVAWQSDSKRRFNYRAEANVRYFGFQNAFELKTGPSNQIEWLSTDGGRETALNVNADLDYALSDKSSIGALIGYNGLYNKAKSCCLHSRRDDVNVERISPFFQLTGEKYSLHAGLRMEVVTTWETRFLVSPDVEFSARSGILAFNANIGGGTHLRSIAWLHDQDYYANPAYQCREAAHSPIDARIALQANPGGKWTVGIEGAWRTSIDETLGGWRVDWFRGMPDYSPSLTPERLSGFSLALNLGLDMSRYFAVNARGTWQSQHGSRGYFNGLDRPELTLEATATSRPTDNLSVSLNYILRAKRLLLPDQNFSRLDLNASYSFTKRFAATAELLNLLNRRQEFLPGVPLEGIAVSAGVQITF